MTKAFNFWKKYAPKCIYPVELLKSLMEEHGLTRKDLSEILGLTKGTLSKILNYNSGFSKETIRKLAEYFKIRQESFNRPYSLKREGKRSSDDRKQLAVAKSMAADR
jgi:HTH-type transcriptional regulator / antitoxin HigA